jgi:hypothetical protein
MKLLTIDKRIIEVYPDKTSWGFTLTELKNLLGGDINIILLDSGDSLLYSKTDSCRNEFATQLVKNIGHCDFEIFGPVLLATQQEIDP